MLGLVEEVITGGYRKDSDTCLHAESFLIKHEVIN